MNYLKTSHPTGKRIKSKLYQTGQLETSIAELEELIKELKAENAELLLNHGIKSSPKAGWAIPIFNREGLSDTWRLDIIKPWRKVKK